MAKHGRVEDTHPDYDLINLDWLVIRDAVAGETTVKDRGETYLPKPDGFTRQDDNGEAMYAGYLLRAKFPELMGPTMRGMVGIIHRIAADIQLPAALEPLRDVCTSDGLSLEAMHERITYEVLTTGRYGLLVDMPQDAGAGDIPYIAGYRAESIVNWSMDRDFYVLDETHLERDGFAWIDTPQYRVLELAGPPDPEEPPPEGGQPAAEGEYMQTLWTTTGMGSMVEQPPVVPQMRGGGRFVEIPFVVIGSTDVSPDLDEIPLLGVVRCQFNIYRLDADYKHQLFMSGQETLFVISDSTEEVGVVGAGVCIKVPLGGDAKYVGPAGTGIAAHRDALSDERMQAVIAGARLFDVEKKAQESGEALKMRWAAQTASLTTVAINSAKGLEQALKYAAEFVGANPDEVVVIPNLEFIDSQLDPQKAVFLMQLWQGGAISRQTMYENLQSGEIASYERSFEEELNLIEQEIPDIQTPTTALDEQKAADQHARTKELQAEAAKQKPKLVSKK